MHRTWDQMKQYYQENPVVPGKETSKRIQFVDFMLEHRLSDADYEALANQAMEMVNRRMAHEALQEAKEPLVCRVTECPARA